MNTIKRSTIAKHFVNNQSFSKNFSLERFKTIKDCYCLTWSKLKLYVFLIENLPHLGEKN